jgi:hypothetical protein
MTWGWGHPDRAKLLPADERGAGRSAPYRENLGVDLGDDDNAKINDLANLFDGALHLRPPNPSRSPTATGCSPESTLRYIRFDPAHAAPTRSSLRPTLHDFMFVAQTSCAQFAHHPGARGRGRTGTPSLARDFSSGRRCAASRSLRSHEPTLKSRALFIRHPGARGRGRTGTPSLARDFESRASTNSATRAGIGTAIMANRTRPGQAYGGRKAVFRPICGRGGIANLPHGLYSAVADRR